MTLYIIDTSSSENALCFFCCKLNNSDFDTHAGFREKSELKKWEKKKNVITFCLKWIFSFLVAERLSLIKSNLCPLLGCCLGLPHKAGLCSPWPINPNFWIYEWGSVVDPGAPVCGAVDGGPRIIVLHKRSSRKTTVKFIT